MQILIATYIMLCILYFGLCQQNTLKGNNERTTSIIFTVTSLVILFYLHCAVDIYSVEDLWSYERRYNEAASMSFSSFNEAFRTKEYVFNYLCKFISIIGGDFRVFLIIYNFILFAIYYYTLKKYSNNVALSIVVFVLVVYFQSIFVLRQHLAIAILLLSIPFILNKKIIPFIFVFLIATNTHLSAVVWLPVYFIYNINNQKAFIVSLILCSVAIPLVSANLDNAFMFLDADYSSYLNTNITTSLTKKIIYVIYAITYCVALKEHIFKSGINRFTTTILFFCTIGYLFAPPVALVDRALTYYSIALIFAIPLIWQYLPSTGFKNLFTIAVFVLQGYVSIQPLFADYYKSFTITNLDPLFYFLMIIAVIIITILFAKSKRYIEKQ